MVNNKRQNQSPPSIPRQKRKIQSLEEKFGKMRFTWTKLPRPSSSKVVNYWYKWHLCV
ncbi:hypothetical protein DCAR_0519717 [Daucus carota subsp. sativus]|uniref:Uncharacterized protein n=1 Tax=Daucus carota subsp. sativus TaxID=79200 RepID=A0A161YKN8_DAUCS|nr:hypothetical protein DCAR_0519717 [Daucus carota subsp. sativus]